MTSRRQFLQTGSTAMLAGMLPATRSLWTPAGQIPLLEAPHHTAEDSDIFALLTRALEAAKAAGATYADARYLGTDREKYGRWEGPGFWSPTTRTDIGVGVRALFNGYWGYSAISMSALTPDTAAQTGRGAAEQAKLLAGRGRPRTAELAPTPVVKGTWTTPVEIDPFTRSWDEKSDVINGIARCFADPPYEFGSKIEVGFTKALQYFASSEGSQYKQTLIWTTITYLIDDRMTEHIASTAGRGWEYVLKAPYDQYKEQIKKQIQDRNSPDRVNIDVGRYDIVFDGASLAKLADYQLGAATELDRAMGYLANTDGTSYLNDPLGMLGNRVMGTPALNVSANRTMPGGAATVKWDDEGVEPDDFQLIKDGVLVDFQTTRESATWLAPYYQKIGKPVRSHGGMTATDTAEQRQQGPHNLVIAPAAQDTSFEALCSGITKGYAILGGTTRVDQQMLNVETRADWGALVYEIVNGKLGRVVNGGVIWTRAPELWKNLVALGGAQTVVPLGLVPSKVGTSRPENAIDRTNLRGGFHTVSAPAARFKQLAVVNNAIRSL